MATRVHKIAIALADDEREALATEAKRQGMPLATFIRVCALRAFRVTNSAPKEN